MSAPDKAAAGQLLSFVERAERLDEEIAGLNADKRDLFAEAKGVGFDVKALKSVLGIRRKDPSERAEHNAIVALYLSTLGMADAADEVEAADPRAHVQVQAPAHVREAEETRRDAGGRGEAQGAATVATVLPAEDATPAVYSPVAQDEGQADDVGEASGEVPERGAGGYRTGQPEEFVTVAEAGEGSRKPDEAASAPDDEVSRESAHENQVAHCASGAGGDGALGKAAPSREASPAGLPPERARRLAEYEADQKANRPPLDPKSSLFPILFKARYGRDPERADYGETA